jgi:hypothetical protein
MSAFTIRPSWRDIRAGASLAEVIRHLNSEMRQRTATTERWANDLEFGPIPGAYVTVVLNFTDTASGLVAPNVLDLAPISFYAVPVSVTFWTDSGQVTCRIDNGADDSILAADAVVTNAGLTVNTSQDFAVEQIVPGDLHLQLLSVDSGTPIHLSAMIILRNVTRADV